MPVGLVPVFFGCFLMGACFWLPFCVRFCCEAFSSLFGGAVVFFGCVVCCFGLGWASLARGFVFFACSLFSFREGEVLERSSVWVLGQGKRDEGGFGILSGARTFSLGIGKRRDSIILVLTSKTQKLKSLAGD
ncbi:hypothetical protein PanWU01x14_134500 [Parasponia andersonii]|uniref:Transmembrane protein n=1 Tax=Parasponia andersonii TaxID=3476 RepID=A0A2P5CPP0_PARAD|nr:hypothetical protein PanWU01x14_134500 [Parasponia andersonii]